MQGLRYRETRFSEIIVGRSTEYPVGDERSRYEQVVSIEALWAREREKVLVRSKLDCEGCDFVSQNQQWPLYYKKMSS
jgi:hypothetical protein